MPPRSPLLFLLLLFFSCAAPPQPPNIVIILADDLGYGDPQIYNPESKIPTPNIDALAQSGVRFTDAHSPSSVCSPTRYGLLTGRYAWRTELKRSVLWSWDPPLIDPDRFTLPKMLKARTYTSALIGKWHLGWRWPALNGTGFANDSLRIGDFQFEGRNDLWKQIDFDSPMAGGPLEAGFDYYFGDDVPNFPPYAFFENNRLLDRPEIMKPDSMFGNPGPMAIDWRLHRVMPAITEKAVDYLHEQAASEQPFFLYFSLTAPHTPIAPSSEFFGTSQAGAYGDFVHEVDWSVGQILNTLEESGALENTLVFFTSDNGSPQRDGSDMSGPIGSIKKYGHDPSRPWRGMKADIWEGGHRVPFIVSWPGVIESGRICHELVGIHDIMATIAGLLDLPVSTGAMEDSYDFSPILLGSDDPGRSSIVHHAIDGTFAIREGDWKLILGRDAAGFSRNLPDKSPPVPTAGQLYRLSDDPAEQRNLYAEHPEVVQSLSDLLHKTQGADLANQP